MVGLLDSLAYFKGGYTGGEYFRLKLYHKRRRVPPILDTFCLFDNHRVGVRSGLRFFYFPFLSRPCCHLPSGMLHTAPGYSTAGNMFCPEISV
jgi:hypothetical protein